MPTRADRIEEILQENGGRLQVPQISIALAKKEGVDSDLPVSQTVRQDNRTRAGRGKAPRFRLNERDGGGDEKRGHISLVPLVTSPDASKTVEEKIAEQVAAANSLVEKSLQEHISGLTWQKFESIFLSRLLESLGFQDVTITQPTKDGGQDAVCTYQFGFIQSTAVVSAKHWRSQTVGLDEVRRIRGVAGFDRTPMIVTSSRFTRDAIADAQPKPGFQPVILIDGEAIVKACFEKGFLVQEVDLKQLPKLFKFDPPTPDDSQPATSQ